MPSTVDYKILEQTIDKMKAKYVPVVKELCLEHLQTFDKSRYIEQIAAEMSEILPDLDFQKIESAALCVSNSMTVKHEVCTNEEKLMLSLAKKIVHTASKGVAILIQSATVKL